MRPYKEFSGVYFDRLEVWSEPKPRWWARLINRIVGREVLKVPKPKCRVVIGRDDDI